MTALIKVGLTIPECTQIMNVLMLTMGYCYPQTMMHCFTDNPGIKTSAEFASRLFCNGLVKSFL